LATTRPTKSDNSNSAKRLRDMDGPMLVTPLTGSRTCAKQWRQLHDRKQRQDLRVA
jgi:hypothetical protein